MQLDRAKIEAAVVENAVAELLDQNDFHEKITAAINSKIDDAFRQRGEQLINDAIADAVNNGFDREYRTIDQWGQPKGDHTTIRRELDRIVSAFWSARVDPKSGKPTDSSYSSVTRAEWVMMSICADDFSKSMKDAAVNVTGALKDGMRAQLGKHMDDLLDSLFKVRSLQDQGKVEKPY